MKDFQTLLKTPRFINLWFSQILSQLTVNIMNFLLLTKLFTSTGSTIATSLLWVAYALPAILVGPIGAASVDIISRRKTLMITNLLQSLTIFGFLLTNQSSIFILYAVVLLYSLFNQFYVPAESSSLPSLVAKNQYAHANSLFFITQQSSLVLGFALAGILQGFIGFTLSLALCAVFLFLAFVSTVFLPEIKPSRKVPAAFDKLLGLFFQSIYEGYKFINNNHAILFPLILLLGMQVSLAVIIVNLPVIATQILNVSVNYVGFLVVVPAGIGAIIGSFIIPRRLKKDWRKKSVIEVGAALLSFGILLLVFLIPLIPIVLRLVFEPIFVVLIGFGYICVTIPTLTHLQEATPLWLRGRVFGNLWFLTTIATIFPVIFSGVITQLFGIKTLLVILMLATMYVFYYSKRNGQRFISEHFEPNGNEK
jgi:MFS family permease